MNASEDDETLVCPGCNSTDVIGISYGYPGPEAYAASGRGEIKFGGCRIMKNSPDWYCKACRCSWPDPERIKQSAKVEQMPVSRAGSRKKEQDDG